MRVTFISVLSVVACISACGGGGASGGQANTVSSAASSEPGFRNKAELGEALFSDVNLSLNRTQSCATCHDPEHAFVDARLDTEGKVVATSLGDDGVSLGDRNTPTAAYALMSPEFHYGSHSRINSQQPDYTGFIGGQFLDGRATDLAAQAEGPPLNPVEMGMPDEASVVQRIIDNSDYVASFEKLYGATVFDTVDIAYDAAAEAIAAFEKTSVFFAFDSRYDRSLTGDYLYDPLSKAAQGKALFFSQQFTHCATCHQLQPNGHKQEVFTNYEYHNIGVPGNSADRLLNGQSSTFVDQGLLDNPEVVDASEKGKFKVPTLRNVAVTAPYMHNGVFRELRTVIAFYDHFLTGSEHVLNPETGVPWVNAEIVETVALPELEDANLLSDDDIDALECFLRTLTDGRYESLLPDDGLCD